MVLCGKGPEKIMKPSGLWSEGYLYEEDSMENKQGLVHIYCGDGKGKTTAAVGMAARAVGRQKAVLFCQLLKNGKSGELGVLRCLPGVTVMEQLPMEGFYPKLSPEQQQIQKQNQRDKFEAFCRAVSSGAFFIAILDEGLSAWEAGILEEADLMHLLDVKHPQTELVLTGRNYPPELLNRADYVSEIKEVRHPFAEGGYQAREGIED